MNLANFENRPTRVRIVVLLSDGWKTGHKIQGRILPAMIRLRQLLQQSDRGRIQRLTLTTKTQAA